MEYIAIRDLKICCESVGDGYPIVLIMGLTANMDWWDQELVEALSRKYRVLIFDNRGAGRTVTPEEGEFTCEMFADDTVALMDAKGIKRANILSMSMGGLIAQELALKYPEKVNNLVLGCTFCGGKHMVQATDEVMHLLTDRSGGRDGIFDRVLKLMFTKDFLDANPRYVKHFKERYLRAPISDANSLRQFIACAKSDTYERLPDIKNPTLVVTGTDDPLIPPQNSQMLAERIPGSKLIEYKGSSHGFMSQARDAFIKDLLDFLAM
ncbi:MAG: alpha/beta fold hydrolase [Deltaproteobacteria bacterium]|nr:alpha/beta fold hydrolase [Deltaproteobacteria bacterium]